MPSKILKYRISNHITVKAIEDNYDTALPSFYRQNHYSLKDACKDKEFVINSTVKYFIDKFSTPKTLKKLIEEVKKELNNKSDDINKTCTSFFNLLLEKKILVHEHKDEQVILKDVFLKEGEVLDGYEIQQIISDRGNIEIYLAFDKNKNLQRVIKLLNASKTSDAEEYEEELIELEREFKMMKSVDHISVMCKAFDFIQTEQYAYITLEYIEGVSLTKFLRHHPELTEIDCQVIINDILYGFSEMHKSGLIHGDIHSSNILIRDVKSLKIIDLGYSRKVEPDGDEVVSYGGVTHYMPPERINVANTRKYTHDADLYSDVYQLGVLVYLVLYNTLPFEGFTWEELSKAIKENKESYPARSFLNYDVPESLKKIIKKCLAKKPSDRYKNAGGAYKAFKKSLIKKGDAA